MKTRILALITSFSLIVLCWTVLHVARVSRNCLDSTFVTSIKFESAGETLSEIPSCDLESYLQFWVSSQFENSQRKLGERISVLARARMLGLSAHVPPVGVVVVEDSPFLFEWKQDQLRLGWEWVRGPGQLERALLQEWLRRQNPVIHRDRFQSEVLSYLALGFLRDELIFKDPLTQESIDLSENRSWLNWVLSLDEYCYSPWVAFEHQEFCDQKNQLKNQERQDLPSLGKVEKLGLAPLVASLMWRRYKKLELSEKQDFWDGFKTSLSVKGVLSRWPANELENPLFLSEVRDWVSEISLQYWTSLGLELKPDDLWIPEMTDLVVEGSSLSAERRLELIAFAKANTDLRVVARSGDKIFLNNLGGVRLSLKGIRARYHLLSGCGSVNKRILKGLPESWVMIVDFCSSGRELNWNSLASGGWEAFIGENSNMKFLGLFLPAVKKIPAWPQVLRLRNKDLKILAKKLGWQEADSWDEGLAAFRPKGVWDAVPFYRL